jgi:hypothetical protein
MTPVAILERKSLFMTQAKNEEEVLQIMERIEKLSQRPENPGMAYRNLETINALMNALRERLGPTETELK